VADRLGQPFDAKFFTVMAHKAGSYNRRMEPQFVDFNDLREFELAAGVTGRPLFGEGAMLNLIEFAPGSTVPLHSHEHEQLGLVLRGKQVLIVDGKEHTMEPLQGYVLPGGVEHSAYCGPDGALVVDVFRPVREDYRERWQAPPP
jgi:quercetin dioxygenase-like cupin family protein